MPDSTVELERVFAERFRHWGIELPAEAVAARRDGHQFDQGWHIVYVWGAAADQEYVEILAQHRMTDDERYRIYASGRVETLPAPASWWSHGPDATPEEVEAAREASFERNRRLYAELRERGLLPPAGQNLPAHEINEHLRAGGEAGEPDR